VRVNFFAPDLGPNL